MASHIDQSLITLRSIVSPLVHRKVTIPSGPAKGQEAIIVIADTGFRFLDLPVEMRNRVYQYVLVQAKPILISTNRTFEHGKTKVISGEHFGEHSYHPGQQWIKEEGKWSNCPPNWTTLLRVNKQIHAEATPIAYGANTFRQGCSTALKWFTPMIGLSVQHLTEVNFGDRCTWGTVRQAFVTLKQATGLRKLIFEGRMLASSLREATNSDEVERWAIMMSRGLRPLLTVLQKAYKARGRTWQAVDVPHLHWQCETLPTSASEREIREAQEREAFAVQMKAKMEKLMVLVRTRNRQYL